MNSKDISNQTQSSTFRWPNDSYSQDNLNYYVTTVATQPNTAVPSTTGPYTIPNTTVNPNYTFYQPSPTLKVQGDAEFESDVKIKGISILKTLEAIESRLAILQPDPKKLEKYEALKKAYEHYKLLEKLLQED